MDCGLPHTHSFLFVLLFNRLPALFHSLLFFQLIVSDSHVAMYLYGNTVYPRFSPYRFPRRSFSPPLLVILPAGPASKSIIVSLFYLYLRRYICRGRHDNEILCQLPQKSFGRGLRSMDVWLEAQALRPRPCASCTISQKQSLGVSEGNR